MLTPGSLHVRLRSFHLRSRSLLGASLALLSFACSQGASSPSGPRAQGQSEFTSAAPGGGNARGPGIGVESGADSAAPTTPGASNGASTTPRTVEETDLYRLEGDRL